jgi:aspartokinase/homoserine dehydrogenase 1
MAVPIAILQLGKGTVGTPLIGQIAAQSGVIRERLGIELRYVAIAGRIEVVYRPAGIELSEWPRQLEARKTTSVVDLIDQIARDVAHPKILVDATDAEGMVALHARAMASGFHVVTCNKKPLAGPLADFQRLRAQSRAARRHYLHEVTVGAGLPVIGTLRDLVDSGDQIISIEGCFSGTLNFLCAGLDRERPFSEILTEARDRGYTEPDPREDLSGQDVARKALILAREAGLAVEPQAVALSPFCEVGRDGDVGSFLAAAEEMDGGFARRWREAAGRKARLRYVATVDQGCGAGLREVPADGPMGCLRGAENVFSFSTARYADSPLVVSGPGAGPEVTAAGAFGDILRVARAVACEERGE